MKNKEQIQELQNQLQQIDRADILGRVKITGKLAVLQLEDSMSNLSEVQSLAKELGYFLDPITGDLIKRG